MAFDFEMIKSLYAKIENSVISAKKILNRPLTSSEKILYSLGIDKKDFNLESLIDVNSLKKGTKINMPGILFKKIEDDN